MLFLVDLTAQQPRTFTHAMAIQDGCSDVNRSSFLSALLQPIESTCLRDLARVRRVSLAICSKMQKGNKRAEQEV